MVGSDGLFLVDVDFSWTIMEMWLTDSAYEESLDVCFRDKLSLEESVESYSTQNANLSDKVTELEKELAESLKKIKAAQEDAETWKKTVEVRELAFDAERDRWSKEVRRLNSVLDKFEEEHKKTRTVNDDLKKELDTMRAEKLENSAQIDLLRRELSKKDSEISSLKEVARVSQRKHSDQVLVTGRKERTIAMLEKSNGQWESGLKSRGFENLRDLDVLLACHDDLKRMNGNLREVNEKLMRNRDSLVEENEDLVHKVDSLELMVSDLESKIHSSTMKIKNLRANLRNTAGERRFYYEKVTDLETELDTFRSFARELIALQRKIATDTLIQYRKMTEGYISSTPLPTVQELLTDYDGTVSFMMTKWKVSMK